MQKTIAGISKKYRSAKISILITSLFFTTAALSNPVINNVAAGNVSIQQKTNTTTINQTSTRAILNWKSFNINANETTHFNQPVGGSTLNRIDSLNGASQIYGRLTATGQVILINPAGIYFGPSAYVNVGSLIATTADIRDQDYLNGNYHFSQPSPYAGAVVNEGQIIARDHGLVALVGAGVDNKGRIQANLGSVVLGSGETFTLDLSGDKLINFSIGTKTSQAGVDKDSNRLRDGVKNSGTIIADGGKIIISAKTARGILDNVINMEGVVQAKSVSQVNGMIILGGDESHGTVRVAARIDASGTGANQKGGKVVITGNQIVLDTPTKIDVSGDAGGGDINIGGSYQGKGPLPNAQKTIINRDVEIYADAISHGNGGNIIVWGDEALVEGKFSARGGAHSGNGGFLETSGHYLNINNIQSVDLRAAFGKTGSWLLDPTNIYIATNQASATAAGMTGNNTSANDSGNPFTASGIVQDSLLLISTLQAALASSNVIVTTANTDGTGLGNIYVVNPITWASGNLLTLNADNIISLGASITPTNGGSLTLNAPTTNFLTPNLAITLGTTGTGTININSNIDAGAGTPSLTFDVFNGATSANINGIISNTGTFTLTKSGSGTLTLNGANTFSGTLSTSSSGSVVLGVNNALNQNINVFVGFSSSLNLNNFNTDIGAITGIGVVLLGSGALTTYITSDTTWDGGFLGTGSVSKRGAGKLTVTNGTNVNDYSGGMFLYEGTLEGSAPFNNVFGTGTLHLYDGTTLQGGAANINTSNPFIVDGNVTFAGSRNITLGVGTLTSGSINVNTTGSTTVLGLIGTAPITINTPSTFTVNNSSPGYSGTITLDAGTLSSLGSLGTGALILNSGTLSLNFATLINSSVQINNNISIITPGPGTATINSPVIGSSTITKSGTNRLLMNGNNTNFTGDIIVNQGSIGGTNANNNLGVGTLTLNTGTTLTSDSADAVYGNNIFANGTVAFTSALGFRTTGTINLSSGTALTINPNFGRTIRISGNIIGDATTSITKTLLGILTIDSPNNSGFLGNLALTLGTVNVNSASNGLGLGSNTVTLSGATLATSTGTAVVANPINVTAASGLGGAGTLTLSNAISVGAQLNVGSTGTVNLNGNLSGTGAIAKSGTGTLSFAGDNSAYTGSVSLSAGTIALGSTTSPLGTFTGANPFTASGGNLQATVDNVSVAHNYTITGLTINGARSLTLTGDGAINGPLAISNTANTITFAGALSGSGNITQSGLGGAVDIDSASNTLSGIYTLTNGTLRFGVVNPLGNMSLAFNGGAIQADVAGLTIANNISISNATPTFSGTNGLTITGAINFITGSTLNINHTSGTLTLAGNLTGTGAIVQNGIGGSAIISGANNTRVGNYTLTNGSLQLDSSNALSTTGTVTLANNAGVSLVLNNVNTTFGVLTGGGATGGLVILSGASNLTVGDATSFSFGGGITGTGNFTKQGSGILTLTRATDYSGSTTINAGTLLAGAANVFSANSQYSLANVSGATLSLNGFNNTIGGLSGGGSTGGNVSLGSGTLTVGNNLDTTFSGVISGTGGLTKQGTGILTLARINTYSGATTINQGIIRLGVANAINSASALTLANVSGVTIDLNGFDLTITGLSGGGANGGNIALGSGLLTINNAANVNYAGVLSGTGGLTKLGAGTFTLSNVNTYTGTTTISAGTLQLGVNNALNAASAIVLANVASANLDLNNFNLTVGSLSGGGATGGNIALGNATLTMGNINNTTYSGVISGTGNIVKQGSGILTLDNANLYTGLTTISSGTLAIANDAALGTAASGTVVSSGATLSLAGSINTGTEAITLNGTGVGGAGALVNSGSSTVGGAITLGSNTSISSSGALVLNGAIDGGANLTLQGTGSIALNSNVGSGTALNAITLAAVANIIGGNVSAASVTATGATTINGNTISTTGSQLYQSSLTLGAASILNANSSIAISNGVTGNQNLTLSANNISLSGTLGLNNLSVTGTGANTALTLNSGSAQNWLFTANNAGNVSATGIAGVGAFTTINNVTGGSANDNFVFNNGISLSGNINGGLGTNSIDYSAYNSAVSVNLAASTATAVNGFSNITSFTGGSTSTDTFIGSNANTTWNITGANQGTSGSTSFASFENITGGNGGNRFVFANGSTINTLNGGSASSTNILDFSSYNAITLNLIGDIFTGNADSAGIVTTYSNINTVVGNVATSNVIKLPTTGKSFNVVYTGARQGYIDDPLYFFEFVVEGFSFVPPTPPIPPTPPTPTNPINVAPILEVPITGGPFGSEDDIGIDKTIREFYKEVAKNVPKIIPNCTANY